MEADVELDGDEDVELELDEAEPELDEAELELDEGRARAGRSRAGAGRSRAGAGRSRAGAGRSRELDEAELELDELEIKDPREYAFNLDGPPQYSDALPLQAMLQPDVAGAAPFSNVLSQSGRASAKMGVFCICQTHSILRHIQHRQVYNPRTCKSMYRGQHS